MGFKDIPSGTTNTKYIVSSKFSTVVNYQERNGYIIINLKTVIDGILDKQKVAKYPTDKLTINIPFDIKRRASTNALNLVVDSKRFTIRLEQKDVVPTVQQKIDFDNTHAHRWKIPQWIKFIENLYYQTYGIKTLEFDFSGHLGGLRRSKAFTTIRFIIGKIQNIDGFNFSDKDVIEYIRWMFAFKGKKPITLWMLSSDGYIQDWLVYLKKKCNSSPEQKKVRSWDQN